MGSKVCLVILCIGPAVLAGSIKDISKQISQKVLSKDSFGGTGAQIGVVGFIHLPIREMLSISSDLVGLTQKTTPPFP